MIPPVAVFAYNRPEHLRQVLEALARTGARKVFLFQDGLREGHPIRPHEQVRELLQRPGLFGEVRLVLRDQNLGLARAIVMGVTEVLQVEERVVVLEDDCVPSPAFLDYSGWMLEHFSADESVLSISGYCPASFPRSLPYDVCHTPLISSWGWATWRNRWEKFNPAAKGWATLLNPRELVRFAEPGTLFPIILLQQMLGIENSWAIRWYLAAHNHRMTSIWPLRSYVRNIGRDGSGEHPTRSEEYDVEVCGEFDPSRLRLPPDRAFYPEVRAGFRRQYSATRVLRRALTDPASWTRFGSRVVAAIPGVERPAMRRRDPP